MSDQNIDERDGEHVSRHRVPPDGRDLEIRLSLQVLGGDDGSPVRVRWVDDQGGSGRAVAQASPASGPRHGKTLLLVGGGVAFVAAVLLGATVFQPRPFSADPQPSASSDLNEPVVPPTASGSPGAAADTGPEADPAGAPPASAASVVDPPVPAAPVLRIVGDLPGNARLFVNGEEMRRRTMSLRPGSYQLEMRAPGFAPARLTVRLGPGDDRSWRPALAPLSLAQTPAPLEVAPAQRIVADAPAPREPTPVSTVAQPVERAPEPVETAPEPPVDPARDLEAARTAIESSLDRLVRALQARSVADLRRVYPGITTEQENRWREFLESSDISDLRVSIAYVQPPVVQGDLAEATFDIVLQFRSAYSGTVRQPTRYGATLERRTADWMIRSLAATR